MCLPLCLSYQLFALLSYTLDNCSTVVLSTFLFLVLALGHLHEFFLLILVRVSLIRQQRFSSLPLPGSHVFLFHALVVQVFVALYVLFLCPRINSLLLPLQHHSLVLSLSNIFMFFIPILFPPAFLSSSVAAVFLGHLYFILVYFNFTVNIGTHC